MMTCESENNPFIKTTKDEEFDEMIQNILHAKAVNKEIEEFKRNYEQNNTLMSNPKGD